MKGELYFRLYHYVHGNSADRRFNRVSVDVSDRVRTMTRERVYVNVKDLAGLPLVRLLRIRVFELANK